MHCTFCFNSFKHYSALKANKGEKPSSCSLCSTSFAHYSALKAHTRIHTGGKPF